MAKDGTSRGGSRMGAGRKSKSEAKKVLEGKLDKPSKLPKPAVLSGNEMPPVKDFLTQSQLNGADFCAEEVYRETWEWLKECGCEKFVSVQTVEQYAMSVARWIQCEKCISEFGLLAQHPTTKNPIASPYVTMAQAYEKQALQVWYAMRQSMEDHGVKDIAEGGIDKMEMLLNRRK